MIHRSAGLTSTAVSWANWQDKLVASHMVRLAKPNLIILTIVDIKCAVVGPIGKLVWGAFDAGGGFDS